MICFVSHKFDKSTQVSRNFLIFPHFLIFRENKSLQDPTMNRLFGRGKPKEPPPNLTDCIANVSLYFQQTKKLCFTKKMLVHNSFLFRILTLREQKKNDISSYNR